MNHLLLTALGITNTQIENALKDIDDGEGVTTIGYTLGLDNYYRECEWDSIITKLELLE